MLAGPMGCIHRGKKDTTTDFQVNKWIKRLSQDKSTTGHNSTNPSMRIPLFAQELRNSRNMCPREESQLCDLQTALKSRIAPEMASKTTRRERSRSYKKLSSHNNIYVGVGE